jgi:Sulfotransferase domain
MAQELKTAKPNFLIIGAPKCGTTSLAGWLQDHDQVFMPANKEPALFLDHYGYRNLDSYIKIFSDGADKPLRGEASAGYLAAPEAPARIRDTLPDVKLIILLRNPARRAFSGWAWMVMEGYEPIANFSEAVAAEDQRANDPQFKFRAPEYFMDYLYFRVGLYAEQIERYFALFPKEQIKIILLDELTKEPTRVYEDTCRFLGIEPSAHVNLTARNVSRIPRFRKLQHMCRRLNQASMYVEPDWLPHGIPKERQIRISQHWLSNAVNQIAPRIIGWNIRHGSVPIEDETTIALLREKYRIPNQRLAALIGRDLSRWI